VVRSAIVNARDQALLWAAQRISAAVLALCVVVHLVTIIYAVRNGLSAAEILGRTRGNVGWFTFYAAFVLAVSIHAPIGLRSVLMETVAWQGRRLDWTVFVIGIVLAFLGFRAVWAVFL
jgi:succinate dehydrogenase subunit C